ncbi:hypothetical protein ACXN5S_03030 [Pseudoroseicyclus sp. H15]
MTRPTRLAATLLALFALAACDPNVPPTANASVSAGPGGVSPGVSVGQPGSPARVTVGPRGLGLGLGPIGIPL